MNILLWVLQIGLGLYYLMGGIYQVTNYKMFTKGVDSMKPVVMGFGLLQALFAVALALPLPMLSPAAAICLVVQTLAVSVVVFKIRKFSALIWIVVPAALSLFVAYARVVLLPF